MLFICSVDNMCLCVMAHVVRFAPNTELFALFLLCAKLWPSVSDMGQSKD